MLKPILYLYTYTSTPKMSLPPAEVLQATILNTLSTNASGSIEDTRTITYNGKELRSAEEQGVVKGVLDSLWSKEVSLEFQLAGARLGVRVIG